jgi:hypothetical protein
MIKARRTMRTDLTTQALSYPIRLPDPLQEEALRLLALSRDVINATIVALWERLDDFGTRESTYAYKQVTAMLPAPAFHGDRLWRCQAEQAGRILRSQAERKQRFVLILPLLSQGMIRPKTEQQPAGKARKVLKVGILPYAADDGGEQGQAYRLRVDLESCCCYLVLRTCRQDSPWRPPCARSSSPMAPATPSSTSSSPAAGTGLATTPLPSTSRCWASPSCCSNGPAQHPAHPTRVPDDRP